MILNRCPHCNAADVLVICHICKQDITQPGVKSWIMEPVILGLVETLMEKPCAPLNSSP